MSADAAAMAKQPADTDRRSGVRRATLWLALLAFAIYGSFILASVLRAG